MDVNEDQKNEKIGRAIDRKSNLVLVCDQVHRHNNRYLGNSSLLD